MPTIDLTTVDELERLITDNDIVLIDFWADWCGPCKMFGPVYEKVSEKYPDAVFTKCETEQARPLSEAFGIQSIPTLAVFREKILVYKQAGSVPESGLDDLISQIKALDMDDVREKMAKAAEAGE